MRDAGDQPSGRAGALWALALIASLEAVVIVALLIARLPSDDARIEAAPAGARDSARDADAALPAALVPAPPDRPREHGAETLPAAATAAPQALVAPDAAGGVLGIVICGSVAAADGAPIGDERVVVGFSDRDSEVAPERGAWSAAGFSPGTVAVTCMAQGFLSQTCELELDASRPVERLDFRLHLAPFIPVAFRTPDGQPLLPQLEAAMIPGRLRAVATLEAPATELTDATPQLGAWLQFGSRPPTEDDDFEPFTQGWSGLIKPHRQPPFFVSAVWGKQVLAVEPVTSPDARITFTFTLDTFFAGLASVRARVVDRADGRPVAGYLAALGSTLLNVNDDGTLHFERVPPGEHTLKLYPPGAWQLVGGGSTVMRAPGAGDYERLELPVECRAGQQVDLGDLAVRHTVSVRGRVTNAAGSPIVTSVSVTAAGAATGTASGWAVLHPHVDEHGEFEVSVVPGRWSFSAGPDSSASPRLVDVTSAIDDLVLIGVGAPVGN